MNSTIHPMYQAANPRFHGIELRNYKNPHKALMWERNVSLVQTKTAIYGVEVTLTARQFSTDETISVEEWQNNLTKTTDRYTGGSIGALIAAGRFYMVKCGDYDDVWVEWLYANVANVDFSWRSTHVFFTKQVDAMMFKLQFGEK